MKQQIHLLFLLLGFLASCDCHPVNLVDGSTFSFRPLDKNTGENLFPNHFDPFVFQIIDDKGDTVDIDAERRGLDGDYYFFLNPTGGQNIVYNQRMSRTYFLQLDSTDTDTLELFFVPRKDDCDEYMDGFEAYYNDELVFTGAGESSYETNIYKE